MSDRDLRPASAAARRALPPWLIQGLKLAFGGLLLWLLFTRVDIARFWAVARESSPAWLAAAVASYFVMVLAATWRWRQLLRLQGIGVQFRALLESMTVALFFNNFLPSNVGGDVMRVRDTAAAAGSPAQATAIVVVDRIAGLVGLILVAAVSSAFAGDRLPFSAAWIWAGLAAGIVGSVAAFRLPALLDGRLERLRSTRVGAIVARLTSMLARFGAAPTGLAECVAISVVVQLASIGLYAAVARALHLTVHPLDIALIVPLASLIQAVPISFNGIGLREAAFTVLFGRAGVPPEAALLLSLEATAVVLGFSLLGGLAYLLRRAPQTSVLAPAFAGESLAAADDEDTAVALGN